MCKDSYFYKLNQKDVSQKIEKKNNLSYLSWAWAWQELKKEHPEANYKVYENKDEWNYFSDGKTGWVKVGVIVENIEHIEYLPIMDFRNKSIPVDNITSFDVNKAIQRALTKAIARHGLGLYIYAGEDLPDDEKPNKEEANHTTEWDQVQQASENYLNDEPCIEIGKAKRLKILCKEYPEIENAVKSHYKIESFKEVKESQFTEVKKQIEDLLKTAKGETT